MRSLRDEEDRGGRVSDLTRAERIRLIEKALRDCGQEVTREAVDEQFYRETKEHLDSEKELPWET